MSETQELVRAEKTSALSLLSVALQNNAAIDVIERLAALQERTMAREAEIDFNDAMNAVQSEVGRVAADLTNPQTHSKYASYAKLDKAIRPIYTKHGFSLSFDTGDAPNADMVRVICYVSRAGHTRTYRTDMPADGKGAKGGDVMTKTHAHGAAMQYGMRYLLKYIFNVAIGEDDTDGNSPMASEWLAEQIGEMRRCETVDGLVAAFKAAFTVALEAKDMKAMDALKEAKEARKKELR